MNETQPVRKTIEGQVVHHFHQEEVERIFKGSSIEAYSFYNLLNRVLNADDKGKETTEHSSRYDGAMRIADAIEKHKLATNKGFQAVLKKLIPAEERIGEDRIEVTPQMVQVLHTALKQVLLGRSGAQKEGQQAQV